MKVKRKYIANLSKQFNIKTLIETGTYFGQSTKYFSKKFDQVYTIELSQELHNFAKKLNSKVNIKF
jgi:predicted O-methyltransferase YrrM